MNAMLKIFSLILILGACSAALAQATGDDAEIRAIASNWERAWNKHDMKALARLFTDDADFVNVGAKHWKGRKEIEAQHSARLGQFLQSTWATKTVAVEYLKPDIALAHIEWSLSGDKEPDGTPRKARDGVFTWVLIKKSGKWLIRAAQNTNVSNLPPPVAVPKLM
ncbi:MAG: SgcJ/EcaC family oxidoreductase [Acidobacteria bacterium]|nr:SgcJ/EcaC family oxidoreductase [Acidobacteriota bacterium]MCA1637125.1 SgcJ/EcaC family oxidoreductase [Acidobacteriota bacterium]